MRRTFADTAYWIAVTKPRDQHAMAAKALASRLAGVEIVTTFAVLHEFLNYFAERGSQQRRAAVETTEVILQDRSVSVVELGRSDFHAAFDLYRRRMDKGYSLTDCSSMVVMRQLSITAVLTNDAHFRREGFTLLMEQ